MRPQPRSIPTWLEAAAAWAWMPLVWEAAQAERAEPRWSMLAPAPQMWPSTGLPPTRYRPYLPMLRRLTVI